MIDKSNRKNSKEVNKELENKGTEAGDIYLFTDEVED